MKRKVLFIEDDVLFLNIYKEAFIQKDIQFFEAMTGKDGLRKVETEKPDVIILDIMLPGGISGFDVLEQLKANPLTKNIPVIVLTNLDSEALVAKKIGAWDYRIKSNTTLKEIVDLVIDCLNSSKPD